MDADTHELACRLYALATELIKAAHETAIVGQGPELAASEYAAGAHALCRHSERLGAIARTILIAIEPETETRQTDRSC